MVKSWLLGGLTLGIVVFGMVLFVATDSFTQESDGLNGWAFLTVGFGALAFALVGLVLTVRLPSLPIGWLFLVGAACGGLTLIFSRPQALPDLGNAFSFAMIMVSVAVVATFPSGRATTRRWRWAVTILAVNSLIMIGGSVVDSSRTLPDFLFMWVFLSTIGVGFAAIVRLFFIYRNGEPSVRNQVKWLLLVMIMGGILLLLSSWTFGREMNLNNLAGITMIVGGPIAVSLAVLRYRLYDIDRIISRTVSYALVAGALGLTYVALVTAGTTVLPTQSTLAVAASTLAIAALFNPLRKRIQTSVDRRFNRSRYSSQSVIDHFTDSLQDRLDVDRLVTGWVDVVSETMQPTSVIVWVKTKEATRP